MHGVPKTAQTNYGLPVNSKEFQTFAIEIGFKEKKMTPKHPKAQDQVVGFNKQDRNRRKSRRNRSAQGKFWHAASLQSYTTPSYQ